MFNKNLNNILPSASMKVGLAENQGPVTNLAIGVPDLKCPDIVPALIGQAAENYTFGYVPSRGSKKALQNLKRLLFNEESLDSAGNLMLVNGAKYGIYLSLKTICNEGDGIILMQPYWLSYPEIIHSLGLSFQSWNPTVTDGGLLSFDFLHLENLIRSHKIKVLILNNPNNPAGMVFPKEWIVQLNSILKKNNIWLLIDEVYRDLVFNPNNKNAFDILESNILRVGSLSKSLSVPGLRLGYICSTTEVINNADLFNQHIQTCVNSLSCYLMENLPVDIYKPFASMCASVYEDRFTEVKKVLNNSGLSVLHSEASFYALINFEKYFPSGADACKFLSEKLNIYAVPGLPYGNHFDKYIRVCLTLPVDVLVEKFQLILKSMPDENI